MLAYCKFEVKSGIGLKYRNPKLIVGLACARSSLADIAPSLRRFLVWSIGRGNSSWVRIILLISESLFSLPLRYSSIDYLLAIYGFNVVKIYITYIAVRLFPLLGLRVWGRYQNLRGKWYAGSSEIITWIYITWLLHVYGYGFASKCWIHIILMLSTWEPYIVTVVCYCYFIFKVNSVYEVLSNNSCIIGVVCMFLQSILD